MNKQIATKIPGPLHVLACYVLQVMQDSLTATEKKNHQVNHRKRYEDILLFTCELLRTKNSHCELSVQTKFEKEGSNIKCRIYTLDVVIKQCVDLGLIIEPGKGKNPYNYDLSIKGKTLVDEAIKDGGCSADCFGAMLLLDSSIQKEVGGQVRKMIRFPIIERKRKMLDFIVEIFQSPVAVPYFDLSDPGLEKFLAGVAERSC